MQALAQQTPSTQKVDRHCAPSTQDDPTAWLHVPEASQSNASEPASTGGAASASPPPSFVPGQPPCVGLKTPKQSSMASGTSSASSSAGTAASRRSANVPRDVILSVPSAMRADAANAR